MAIDFWNSTPTPVTHYNNPSLLNSYTKLSFVRLVVCNAMRLLLRVRGQEKIKIPALLVYDSVFCVAPRVT